MVAVISVKVGDWGLKRGWLRASYADILFSGEV